MLLPPLLLSRIRQQRLGGGEIPFSPPPLFPYWMCFPRSNCIPPKKTHTPFFAHLLRRPRDKNMGGGGQRETGVREKRGGGELGVKLPPLFPSRLDVGDSCVPLFRTVTKSVLQTQRKGPPPTEGAGKGGEGGLWDLICQLRK